MSLLVYTGNQDWIPDEELQQKLSVLMPDVTIYCGIPEQALPDVRMLAITYSPAELWDLLPNLQLVQKLGAGVNLILDDPLLPEHIRITRLAPTSQAREIAEYSLLYILGYQRHLFTYEDQARQRIWKQFEPRHNNETTVGILGLGHIGSCTAELIASFGFKVTGWSRSQKSIPGVESYSGTDGLEQVLSQSDYVVSILPSTPKTLHLIDARRLSQFKPGAILINAGRGDLIDTPALLNSLDSGRLSGAVLDVFEQEPLDKNSALWHHPAVRVTPHISGWNIESGFRDIVENYRRITAGQTLLHEVDRELGY
ncbi:MAG: glyoxylate/hydroxypyruvate reductase A [Parasphingorhabdus sp.]|jgi:glyoxylate/hydroxypyruvate reductase A